MFEQCAQRWEWRYIDKLPDPSGEAAHVGSFAHLVLENLYKREPEARTQGEAQRLAKLLWPGYQGKDQFQALELDEDETREFKWKAWNAVLGIWDLEHPEHIEVVALEQWTKVKLEGDVPFIGVVDRVERVADVGLIVGDYKSGKPPKPQFESDKTDQVLLYAAAVKELMGEMPYSAKLLFLGHRTIEVESTAARVGEAVDRLRGTWRRIGKAVESGEFEPDPSVLCAWCPYIERCDAGRDELVARAQSGWFRPDAPAHDYITKVMLEGKTREETVV